MNILERQLWEGRMYSHTLYFRNNLRFAYEGIKAMLDLCPRTYVSISFGKQSICLAHMVWKLRPKTPMYFLASSESYLMHNFVEVIDAFMQIAPINLTIVQTNHAALDIRPCIERLSVLQPAIVWDMRPAGNPNWNWHEVREAGHWDLQTMVDRDAYNGWFWGLAKEESKARRITLSTKWEDQPHPSIFRYGDGKFRCCPLMNWRLHDLAAYIQRHELPLLDTYHKEGLTARTTARMTGRSSEEGAMALIHQANIGLANQMYQRFPELRAAR